MFADSLKRKNKNKNKNKKVKHLFIQVNMHVTIKYEYKINKVRFVLVSLFNSISTFVGYLMPKPSF